MKKITLLLTEAELAALRSSLLTVETEFKNRYCHDCNEAEFVNPHKVIRERVDRLTNPKSWFIDDIKAIIDKWGETTIQDLNTNFSPVVESNDEFRSVAEGFYKDHVRVVTYDNGCNAQLSESDIPYEMLDEGTMSDIFMLLDQYDTDSEKTLKRCAD